MLDSGLDVDSCFMFDPKFPDIWKDSAHVHVEPVPDVLPYNAIPDDTQRGANTYDFAVSGMPGVTIYQNLAHRKVGVYMLGQGNRNIVYTCAVKNMSKDS